MKPTELYNAVTDAVAQAPAGQRTVVTVYASRNGSNVDLGGYPHMMGGVSGDGRREDLVLRLTPLHSGSRPTQHYISAKEVVYLSVFYVEDEKTL